MTVQSILDDVDRPLEWCVELDSVRNDRILSFDGTDYVDFGDTLDQGAADSFTVEGLFHVTALADATLFTKKASTASTSAGWRANMSTGVPGGDAGFAISISDGTTEITVLAVAAAVRDGKPHRFSLVVDRAAQVFRVYLDGVLIGTSASIAGIGSLTNAAGLRVGAFGDGTFGWASYFEDFRFWTVARTQAQIQATMARGAVTGSTSGLALLARMNEGEGTRVNDISGNGHNGTITGATWVEISKTWYYSTHQRETGSGDTPASTPFNQFLLNGKIGPLAQTLAEDQLFGGQGATVTPDSLVVVQESPTSATDRLSQLQDYTFAGRKARVKVGHPGDAYSTFEIYRTSTVDKEPSVVLADTGLKAEWQLASVFGQLLSEDLDLPKYVGIPHCLKLLTSTGKVTVPRVAAHDASRFVVAMRFRTTTAAATRLLMSKFISVANNHFYFELVATTGKVALIASSSGAADISFTSPTNLADGNWHSLAFARDNDNVAYFLVDREVVGTFTPKGIVNLTVANIVIAQTFGGDDTEVLDVRMYDRYIPPEELIGVLATRAQAGDTGLVMYLPFTDNGGAVVNDEGTANSDGAISGVLNTDYSWGPSDLGEAELAGQPYPFAIGDVYNAQAHLIDSVRERYRLSSEDLSSGVSTIKSQGTQLTGGGTDYTLTDSDRIAQMVSQESEPVTFDRSHAGTVPSLAYPTQLAYDALINRTRLTSSDISQRYDSMKSLAGWRSGFFTDANINGAQLLKSLLGDAGMHYTESDLGLLYMDMLLPPVGYGPFGDPAFDFNGGRGSEINFAGIGSIADSPLTICGWINTPAVNGTTVGGSEMMYIAGTDLGSVGEYNLRFQNRSGQYTQLRFGIAGNTTLDSAANPILPFEWHFVVGVFDDAANEMRMYVGRKNGTLALIAAVAAPNARTVVGSGDFIVGSRLGEDAIGWGALQHVQVYNVAKTYAELVSIMADPAASPTGLVRYVAMNEGTGVPTESVTATQGVANGLDHFTHRWAPKLEIDLDTNPEVRLTDFRRAAPASKVDALYAHNQHPMTEIDTGLSQAARWALMREWKSAPLWLDSRVSQFKRARTATLESPLADQSGAINLARLMATRLSPGRSIGSLNFPDTNPLSRQSLGLSISDEVGVKVALPSGLSLARSFRVTAVAPRPLELSNTINFWG